MHWKNISSAMVEPRSQSLDQHTTTDLGLTTCNLWKVLFSLLFLDNTFGITPIQAVIQHSFVSDTTENLDISCSCSSLQK